MSIVSFFKNLFHGVSKPEVNPPKPAPIVAVEPPPVGTEPNEPNGVLRPRDLPASCHYPSKDLTVLTKEYEYLWSITSITPKWKTACDHFVLSYQQNKAELLKSSLATGVPVAFIAATFMREASMDFARCLHNGEKIIGNGKKTTKVPAGRGPFASWSDATIDALKYMGYAGKNDWCMGMTLWRLEAYNGWGYRTGKMQGTTPKNSSPYIYSGTPFYVKGRSIEDHSWYPESVDDQLGCMAFLKALELAGEKVF